MFSELEVKYDFLEIRVKQSRHQFVTGCQTGVDLLSSEALSVILFELKGVLVTLLKHRLDLFLKL